MTLQSAEADDRKEFERFLDDHPDVRFIDGITIDRELNEWSLRRSLAALVSEPETELHLINKGGSRETVVRHAALADSLLSMDEKGHKVRTAVYMHGW